MQYGSGNECGMKKVCIFSGVKMVEIGHLFEKVEWFWVEFS